MLGKLDHKTHISKFNQVFINIFTNYLLTMFSHQYQKSNSYPYKYRFIPL